MFAYADAQLYRLGVNNAQIPVNRCPFEVNTYQHDGSMNVGVNGDGGPNYFPNSFNGLVANTDPSYNESVDCVTGDVKREDLGGDHFSQAKWFYETQMSTDERQRAADHIVSFLSRAVKSVQLRLIKDILSNISKDLAARVTAALNL